MTWKPIKGALTAPVGMRWWNNGESRFSGNYRHELRPKHNRLAREKMKLKLMQDIRTDLMVCEIEGWDKMEYLNELKELIDGFFKQTERSGE